MQYLCLVYMEEGVFDGMSEAEQKALTTNTRITAAATEPLRGTSLPEQRRRIVSTNMLPLTDVLFVDS